MTKFLIVTSLFVAVAAGARGFIFHAQAATSFKVNLAFGTTANSDVTALQQFLTTQSFYFGPVTGNFFSLTLQGVKNFQAANNITPVSGYFGPLTRAKANAILATASSSPFASNHLSWGVYTGNSSGAFSSFANLVGKSPDIQAIFLSMGLDSFPTNYTQSVGETGKTLLIFWEPDNGASYVNQPDFNYDAILSGKYDANMKQFAAAAKAYGYPVILVPMAEMNGNWSPWGGTVNGNTPAKFSQAWIHVHDFFTADTNVKFGWAVNNQSVPNTSANAISAYWPGAQYVDYVGVDGFNGNGDPWQSFSQIFPLDLMKQLATYGKPVYIFSMGSSENPADASGKANWITQGLGPNGVIASFPGLAGWIWFNKDNGNFDSNWLVNSDSDSLSAFKAAIPN
jgi:peptidoglycan hydrolase-like protein with peptidoglycan-binding domain